MGDTLFHLIPEIFLGESDDHDVAKFVLVEPNRNLLLGVAILVGFMTFVAMDKAVRIATGSSGHDHGHSHSHSSSEKTSVNNQTTAIELPGSDTSGLKSRRKPTESSPIAECDDKKDTNTSIKMGGFLNLM